MDITRVALERSRVTFLALAVVFLSGVSAYFSLPRNEDPGFIVRTAAVTTVFPGASPERVEQLVTDKLEKAIQEIPQLDTVRSESYVGLSLVYVDIKESYTDMRPIWDDLRRKVDGVRPDLPEGIVGPTVNDEFGDVFGTIVTVSGEDFEYAELKEIADEVRDEFLRLEDVAKVTLHGVQEERVFVEYDNARLAELGISPGQFQTILENRNIIIPGGSLRVQVGESDERIVLEPTGNFESVRDIERTVISLPGRNDVMYLEDLATVRRDYVDPPVVRMHSSGKPAIALAVSMREGGDIVGLGQAITAHLRELEAVYPHGLDFETVAFQPERVDKKVKEFVVNLLQSVAIVFLVMLLFLGLRTGIVVATLVPGAILMSFALMGVFDVGLDQISLASLIIALGMLVDNAIVMSESIMVSMAAGRKPLDAAIESANELKVPLLTSTLTTSAAFLPIYLAESSTGEYTGPIFVVVTLTLLSSWILALTMIPLLCVLFLRVKSSVGSEPFESRFYRAYRGLLVGALKARYLVLLLMAGALWLALQGFQKVPVIFFPSSDRSILSVELTLPPWTPLERTEEVVYEIEDFFGQDLAPGSDDGSPGEGIVSWASFVGEGAPRYILTYGPTGRQANTAYLIVNTTSSEVIPELIERLDRFCLERFPGLEVSAAALEMGPPVKWPVEVRISGRDSDRVFAYAELVQSKLRGLAGTKLVRDDWGPRAKKLLVRVDQDRAFRARVSSRDVAVSLQTMLSGFVTTQYREDDDLIPVVMRSPSAWRDEVDKIEGLNVYAQATGASVPLVSVADLEVAWQPSKILRRGRLRSVSVQAKLEPGATASEVLAELEPWLEQESRTWAPGTYWELGGEAETSGEANESIAAKLPIAGFLILLLLVMQFNSFRKTAIVLLTIPLGVIGVVIGLLTAQSYFGFMTLLGIISLSGIVINNAIVLLDRIRIEIDDNGLDPARAIVESAQRRLRPILLTTCTTAGGLLPLWLGDPGGMFVPMAIAIVFGLMFATVLTLGLVPILYSIFYRVSFKGFRYSPAGPSPSQEAS